MPSYSIFLVACSVILAISLQSGSTHAFTGSNFALRSASIVASSPASTRTSIFSTPTPENEGDAQQQQLNAFVDPLSANKPSAPAVVEEKNYPIDLPSPILLASSMVLAIIGVGKRKRNEMTRHELWNNSWLDWKSSIIQHSAWHWLDWTRHAFDWFGNLHWMFILRFSFRNFDCIFICAFFPCCNRCRLRFTMDQLMMIHLFCIFERKNCMYAPYACMNSAGSGFDIFSDEPRFPFAVNLAISAGGLSVCLGLFYASILKAQAETEEDDRKYMSGR